MRRPGEDNMTDQIRQTLESYLPGYNKEAWKKLDKRLENYEHVKGSGSFRSWTIGFITGLLISLGISSYFILFNRPFQNDNSYISEEIVALREEIKELKKSQQNLISKTDLINTNRSYNKSLAELKQINVNSLPVNQYYNFYSDQSDDKSLARKNNSYESSLSKYLLSYSICVDEDYFGIDTLHVSKKNDTNCNIEREKEKKKREFKFELPVFSFKSDEIYKHFIGPDKVYIDYSPSLETGTFQDKNGIAHGGGIGLSGQISNNIIISGGINLGQYSWGKETSFGHYESEITDSLDTQWVVDTIIKNTGNVMYLDVPIDIGLRIFEVNKSSMYLNAGISARFYIKERYEETLTIGEDVQNNQLSYGMLENYHILAKLNLGLCYSYLLSERWSIQAIPRYSFSLQELGGKEIKNSSWGLSLNLVYKFRKEQY